MLLYTNFHKSLLSETIKHKKCGKINLPPKKKPNKQTNLGRHWAGLRVQGTKHLKVVLDQIRCRGLSRTILNYEPPLIASGIFSFMGGDQQQQAQEPKFSFFAHFHSEQNYFKPLAS